MNKNTVTIAGVLIVIAGLFSPLFTAPSIGPISYAFQIQGPALLMSAAVLAGAAWAFFGMYWPLFAAGLFVAADVGIAFGKFFFRMGSTVDSKSAIVDALSKVTLSPSWGFIVLLIGAGLLVATPFAFKKAATPALGPDPAV